MSSDSPKYGVKDNSYTAAGELAGLTKLVDSFYAFMEALPEARVIRSMHSEDLTESKKNSAIFYLAG